MSINYWVPDNAVQMAESRKQAILEHYLTIRRTEDNPFEVEYVDEDCLKRAIEVADKVIQEQNS